MAPIGPFPSTNRGKLQPCPTLDFPTSGRICLPNPMGNETIKHQDTNVQFK